VFRVVELLRVRVRTLQELAEAARCFLGDVDSYDPQGVRKYFQRPGAADILAEAKRVLEALPAFDAATLERAYRELAARLGIGTGELFHPTRLAVTGRTVGPGLFETMELIGLERCLDRLERAIAFIRSLQAAPTTP